MDDIIEFLVELLFEGITEAAGSKGVPKPLRWFLGGILIAVFLGIFVLLLMAAWDSGSILLTVFVAAVMLVLCTLLFKKVQKMLREENKE